MALSHTQCGMMAIYRICVAVPPKLFEILPKKSSEMPAHVQSKATVVRTSCSSADGSTLAQVG